MRAVIIGKAIASKAAALAERLRRTRAVEFLLPGAQGVNMARRPVLNLRKAAVALAACLVGAGYWTALGQTAGQRSKPVKEAVNEARAKGVKEITLSPWIVEHFGWEGWDAALHDFALVDATLEAKRTVIDPSGYSLLTYLRFKVVRWLSSPPAPSGPVPEHVPRDMREIPSGQFIIGELRSGQLNVGGVQVKSGNSTLEELAIGSEYLVFADFVTAPRYGWLPYGLSGVFRLSASRSVEPIRPRSDVAAAFKRASLTNLSDVEAEITRHPERGQIKPANP